MDVSLDVGDEKKPYFIVTLTIFAGLIYLLACFCITLTQHDTNLASLWFPTAATIAFLFHHRKHQWPFILIAAQLATMAANWTFFPISLFSVQLALINQVQAVVCTLLLSRFLNHKSPINGLYTWLRFVICSVILAPLFSAMLAATIVSLHGLAPFNQIFGVWFMSESISVMALTPVGLLYYRGFWRKSLNERTLTESIMIIAIAMVSCFYAMQYLPFPFTFAIIPMLWAAIRLPLLQAFTSFLCVIILLAIMMAYHVVDIRSAYPSVNDVLVYTPLLLVLLPVNSVAVLMHAFRLERDHIEESETRFRNVIEFSAIGTALVALDGRWIQVNPALCQMLGYPARTLTDMTFQDITHRDDLESDLSQLSALVEGKISSYSMEKRYLHSSGTSIWTLLSVSLIRDPQGEPLYFVSQIKDISEIKNNERYKQQLLDKLHEEKERLHITLTSIGDAVISTDSLMRVTFMNPVAEKMTGWTQEEALGLPIDNIVHLYDGIDGDSVYPLRTDENSHTRRAEDRLILKNLQGAHFDVQSRISELTAINGNLMGYVLVFQDVSESRELLRKLSYSALHDPLTGLPNRVSFEQALKRALRQAVEEERTHALIFLDLDRFKAVNDSAGHAAGDALLQKISQLMHSNIRTQDILARLGGDEFAFILIDCEADKAKEIITRVINQINDYIFEWEGKLHRVGASAGMTLINIGNALAVDLMNQADIACYTAKHSGRGKLMSYEPKHKQHINYGKGLLSAEEIDDILTQNRINIQAQGIAPPKTPQSIAFYNLELIPHSTAGINILPELFQESCFQNHRREEIDRWMLREVLENQAQALKSKGISIAIPVATSSLCNPTFTTQMFEMIQASQLPPTRLLIRIPESALNEDYAHAQPALNTLTELGCRLIVEDFGRNLSVTERLQSVKIEYVMITPTLITNVHCNQMDEVLVSIIHGNAWRHGAQTIAGPADIQASLLTLDSIKIDLTFGNMIQEVKPLSSVLQGGYFGIN